MNVKLSEIRDFVRVLMKCVQEEGDAANALFIIVKLVNYRAVSLHEQQKKAMTGQLAILLIVSLNLKNEQS